MSHALDPSDACTCCRSAHCHPSSHPAPSPRPTRRLYDALSPFIREEAKAQLLEKLESLEVRTFDGVLSQRKHGPTYLHNRSWPCVQSSDCFRPSILAPPISRPPSPPSTFPTLPQNWLYEEGEDETKSVYVAKLAEFKGLGGPVEARAANAAALPAAADSLRRACQVGAGAGRRQG